MNESYLGFSGNTDITGPNEPTIAQKSIILSAPLEQQPSSQFPNAQQTRLVRPEDLVRMPKTALPANPVARISYLWKRDPAYRVLFIAISVVILSSFVFVSLVSGMFNQPNTQNAQGDGTNPQQSTNLGGVNTSSTPTVVPTSVPASTVAAIPTLIPTPTPFPTPTEAPTQPPTNARLTVQISNIPQKVKNNTSISVDVTTNEPGASVFLVVKYVAAAPFYSKGQPQSTDDNGNSTILWQVEVVPIRPGATITAQVSVVAQNQRGMYVTSPETTVQITTKGA
jgi:hypothetical protein